MIKVFHWCRCCLRLKQSLCKHTCRNIQYGRVTSSLGYFFLQRLFLFSSDCTATNKQILVLMHRVKSLGHPGIVFEMVEIVQNSSGKIKRQKESIPSAKQTNAPSIIWLDRTKPIATRKELEPVRKPKSASSETYCKLCFKTPRQWSYTEMRSHSVILFS